MGLFILLLSVGLGLTANELCVVEIVDAHSLAHFIHGLCSSLASFLRTFLQDVVDFGNILLELVAIWLRNFLHFISPKPPRR